MYVAIHRNLNRYALEWKMYLSILCWTKWKRKFTIRLHYTKTLRILTNLKTLNLCFISISIASEFKWRATVFPDFQLWLFSIKTEGVFYKRILSDNNFQNNSYSQMQEVQSSIWKKILMQDKNSYALTFLFICTKHVSNSF